MYGELLLFAHAIGATVLFGTDAGITFFMVVSNRSGEPSLIAHTAAIVVLADMIFTATAALAQPITGWLLAVEAGWSFTSGWLFWALMLYVLVGIFWLPVVWMQMRMLAFACQARDENIPLPPAYHRFYRLWLLCGFPAFFAVLAIFWLMLTRLVL